MVTPPPPDPAAPPRLRRYFTTLHSSVDALLPTPGGAAWEAATIMAVNENNDSVLVHPTYFPSSWDVWLPSDSPSIAPAGTHVFTPGGAPAVGQRVDVFDTHPSVAAFLPARIIEVDDLGGCRVHFSNYDRAYDTWLPRGTDRLAPAHSRTRQRCPFVPSEKRYWTGRVRAPALSLGGAGSAATPAPADARCDTQAA